jgi:hypothetical protein
MDLGALPPWCLFDAVARLGPPSVAELAQTSPAMADLCTSQALWKALYSRAFPPASFRLHAPSPDADWVSRFSCRHAIASNIARGRAKVQSFPDAAEIRHLRTLTNAFAYNTARSIVLVVCDYLECACQYQPLRRFEIEQSDFVFMDERAIACVGDQNVTLLDIATERATRFAARVGPAPHIQPIDANLFAVVSTGDCFVYDVREGCDRRCQFAHARGVLATAHRGTTLFVSSQSDVTAHDVRNPRGPVLWNFAAPGEVNKFCAFNVSADHALFGTHVVNLTSGSEVWATDVAEPECGSVLDAEIVITGCKRTNVVFSNYARKERIGAQQFGEDEGIKSIAGAFNGRVMVAGDFTIRTYSVETRGGQVVVEPAQRLLRMGSIKDRKSNAILPVKEVVFDGERCITNNGQFVRVYDYFNGKPGGD